MDSIEKKAYIFGTIFTLSNKLQVLGDRMDPKLTVKQWLFLTGVLKCGDVAPTISEVAALIGSSRQNVKKMALILEKQGFVSMNKDAADSRMLRISLTDSCVSYLKQREDIEIQFINELFHGFEEDELTALLDTIKKLENNTYIMERNYEDEEE